MPEKSTMVLHGILQQHHHPRLQILRGETQLGRKVSNFRDLGPEKKFFPAQLKFQTVVAGRSDDLLVFLHVQHRGDLSQMATVARDRLLRHHRDPHLENSVSGGDDLPALEVGQVEIQFHRNGPFEDQRHRAGRRRLFGEEQTLRIYVDGVLEQALFFFGRRSPVYDRLGLDRLSNGGN